MSRKGGSDDCDSPHAGEPKLYVLGRATCLRTAHTPWRPDRRLPIAPSVDPASSRPVVTGITVAARRREGCMRTSARALTLARTPGMFLRFALRAGAPPGPVSSHAAA